ncbi:general L-amino acid transport system substrate-binding protein [Pararhizobium capsulatum DSM 1112]|uniref:General L-amino acid transport system substrate-binding protein n=1 Tax=Pararhizobium capsulatum DSM 1112 TaxID=1121113 RepID=A0ABU0BY81_9HYPH|nr:amino acid ABC transporter substrate-binding protein [Pararhizobium capsulatum]MDQ0323218.1 general L-amino acid transport system substrate-binding protein [Pararhizobium capsulatum DSM 1112]
MKFSIMGLVTAAFMASASVASAEETLALTSKTLDAVKARGQLSCGVIGVSPGFSLPDSQGVMRGIDADQCRAVAAATLGDAEKVKWVVLTPQQRFTALQSGEVDVVYANVTWTMTRESQLGLQFPNIYYYDGIGFMVKKSLGVTNASGLDGGSLCMLTGGTTELSVQEYFSLHKLTYTPVLFSEGEEARKALLADRCDAYVSDVSDLAASKAARGDAGNDLLILPERITAEPLGGVVRKGDQRWFDIVRWTHYTMVNAEVLGIDSKNLEKALASENPAVQRFLGLEGELGQTLGLANDFTQKVIKQVGNFGEVWDRNIVGVDRGMNNVWTKGGLQYSPPFR